MKEAISKNWANSDLFSNQNFPFTQTNPMEKYDLSSINAYVQNVLAQVATGDSMLSTEIFETHQSVIVKIKLTSQQPPSSVRIWVNANHVKIIKAQDARKPKEQILNLPCRVDARARKTVYKKGILEIRIPKVNTKDRYHEVIF